MLSASEMGEREKDWREKKKSGVRALFPPSRWHIRLGYSQSFGPERCLHESDERLGRHGFALGIDCIGSIRTSRGQCYVSKR